jgi:hypothetical protein
MAGTEAASAPRDRLPQAAAIALSTLADLSSQLQRLSRFQHPHD